MNNKDSLRKKFKALRDRLPASYRRSSSKQIARKLFSLPAWRKARSVGIYLNARSEVDTKEILRQALAQGKLVKAPKVLSESKMRFFEISGMKDCKAGAFGIFEPK